jgi:hypothetical protein
MDRNAITVALHDSDVVIAALVGQMASLQAENATAPVPTTYQRRFK